MSAVLLSDGDWEVLREQGRHRRWPAGRAVCREGDASGWVLAVADGRIKLTVGTPTGRELLLAVKGPGELLGEHGALDGSPRSATAIALEPVEGWVLDSQHFGRVLEERPHLAVALARHLAGELRRASAERASREEGDVTVRVARRLVDLSGRFGEHNGPGLLIGLPLSQDDLAAWVGASREATNRALSELRAAGCIETSRKRIVVVDADRLAAAG